MKNLIIILLMFTCISVRAQKKGNVFASLEFLRQTGASLYYNHKLSNSKFGIGAGVQVVNFKSDSYSALADFRYYIPVGKSTFIPNIQIGKNFDEFGNIRNPVMPSVPATGKGGFHSNFNMGYSYKLLKNGGGPYINSGVRFLSYNYFANGSKVDSNFTSDFLLSVGFRF